MYILYRYRHSIIYPNSHVLSLALFLVIDDCNVGSLHVVFIGSGSTVDVVSLVIPAVVTVIVATSAGYEDAEYPSIEAERLARYAPSVLDPTRVNFALTFSPSCALRITRGEARKKHGVAAWISTPERIHPPLNASFLETAFSRRRTIFHDNC